MAFALYLNMNWFCVPRDYWNNREGHTDITPVNKEYFTWSKQGVRCYPKFQL